jgi:hypothetical protein
MTFRKAASCSAGGRFIRPQARERLLFSGKKEGVRGGTMGSPALNYVKLPPGGAHVMVIESPRAARGQTPRGLTP